MKTKLKGERGKGGKGLIVKCSNATDSFRLEQRPGQYEVVAPRSAAGTKISSFPFGCFYCSTGERPLSLLS